MVIKKEIRTRKSQYMLKVLSIVKPWMMAWMCVAAPLMSQNSPSTGVVSSENDTGSFQRMMAGYNAPSSLGLNASWDIFVTGSFIYWQPSEDNLALGVPSNMTSMALPYYGTVVNMDFGFKPGLKVGLGADVRRDHWVLYSEYTWLQSTDRKSFSAAGSNLAINYWAHPNRYTTFLTTVSGEWQVHLNLLDLVLQRSYFVGSQLTFTPFFGLRAAWIDQQYLTENTEQTTLLVYQTFQKSTSWGVGPRTGLDADWLLGYGIRFYGKTMADLLYTQYGRHIVYQNPSTPSTMEDINVHEYGIETLRSHAEIELGFGWGSSLSRDRMYIDLAAGYDFQVFWRQNMFIEYVDNVSISDYVARDGNLYLQGLTASLRLDF